MQYRVASKSDVPSMARIRAAEWESEEYWTKRITGYMDCEIHPQHALKPRVIYVALDGDSLAGLIAGHLTRRYGCDGELEWINVGSGDRGTGVAPELLRLLAHWFVDQGARRICVDVEPANTMARRFYMRHGAEVWKPHWLVWNDIGVVFASHPPDDRSHVPKSSIP
jgi:ribosomal protein S18 acetylase RimI-like enzyme